MVWRREVDCSLNVTDRPTHACQKGRSRPGMGRPTDPPPRAARRKFWAGTARPADPAAHSAAKNLRRQLSWHARPAHIYGLTCNQESIVSKFTSYGAGQVNGLTRLLQKPARKWRLCEVMRPKISGRPTRPAPTLTARSAAKNSGRDGPTDRPCRAQRGENLGRDCPDRPTLSRRTPVTFNEQSTSRRPVACTALP